MALSGAAVSTLSLRNQSYQWQLSGIPIDAYAAPGFCLTRCKPEGETFLGAVGVPAHLCKILRGISRVICGNTYTELGFHIKKLIFNQFCIYFFKQK